MWVKSWNEQGYKELALDSSSSGNIGYNIRFKKDSAGEDTLENSNTSYKVETSNLDGFYDTLYFPYTNYIKGDNKSGNAYGYWLASSGSANGTGICSVNCYGEINCNYKYDNTDRCVRPVISIPKSIFEEDATFTNITLKK